MAQRTQTEATILAVSDDASWKFSIEADIPAFDGDRSYKYLVWKKDQGQPPQPNTTVLATLVPYQRSKFYVDRGDLAAGPVDDADLDYHVTWNMIAADAVGATNGAPASNQTAPLPNAPLRRSSDVSGSPATVYRPAPTQDERHAEAMAKFRRDQEGVNDRKAVSDILATVEPGTYTLGGLIEDATSLAAWYNGRLAARCEPPPLVQAAQDAGAVVVDLFEDPPPANLGSWIKNKADLSQWVTAQGWTRDAITRVLADAGYASSSEYLDDLGNSVQGLAELLHNELST